MHPIINEYLLKYNEPSVRTRIECAEMQYYYKSNSLKTQESFNAWLMTLRKEDMEHRQIIGFETSKYVIPFIRFVLEENGIVMDDFMKDILTMDDYAIWVIHDLVRQQGPLYENLKPNKPMTKELNLSVLGKINYAVVSYYSKADKFKTFENYSSWLETLSVTLKDHFQSRGFEQSQNSFPFMRYVLELNDIGMDEHMKANLSESEFFLWKNPKANLSVPEEMNLLKTIL